MQPHPLQAVEAVQVGTALLYLVNLLVAEVVQKARLLWQRVVTLLLLGAEALLAFLAEAQTGRVSQGQILHSTALLRLAAEAAGVVLRIHQTQAAQAAAVTTPQGVQVLQDKATQVVQVVVILTMAVAVAAQGKLAATTIQTLVEMVMVAQV